MEGAPVVDLRVATCPIAIKLPDRSVIYSTRIGNLDIPWLPGQVIECHIVPGLAHTSLLLVKKFCEAKYMVVFDEEECRVYYKGKLVLFGGRDHQTTMWKLPINPQRNNVIEGLNIPL